jgi:hypothetical protein
MASEVIRYIQINQPFHGILVIGGGDYYSGVDV